MFSADVFDAKILELAEKWTSPRPPRERLPPEERDEYETYVRVGTLISILQAKARRLLARNSQF